MEVWGIVITLLICALILITVVYLIHAEAYLVSLRVICDRHDMCAFTHIIDVIAENENIKYIAYRERDDVTIFDISCRRCHYDTIKQKMRAIANVEVN